MASTTVCRVSPVETPLGMLLCGAIAAGVCLIAFPDSEHTARELDALRRRMRCDIEHGEHPLLAQLRVELRDYFSRRLTEFTVPVVTAGTPFQQRVWRQLRRIPYGTTCSYEELARAVDAEGAQRAVGHANGSNPVPIVIPCHRVINKNGKLGGYGGELWRKQALLRLERAPAGLPFDASAES